MPRTLQSFFCLRGFMCGIALLLNGGCLLRAQAPISTDTFISPTSIQVHAGEVAQFKVTRNGVPATNGYWVSGGTGDAGWIDSTGLYRAPWQAPSPAQVPIDYFMGSTRAETVITVTNPIPKPNWTSVSSFTQISTPIQINGNGFVPGTTIYVQGRAMPTTVVGPTIITAVAVLSGPLNGNVPVVVQNPAPGPSAATLNIPAVFPAVSTMTPASVTGGWVNLALTGAGYTASTVVLLDGRPMNTTVNSATSITATAYLPSWRKETAATVTVLSQTGSVPSVTKKLPITALPVTYDAAARFTTQAAFGPRPGLVEHIQLVGLQGFLAEQMALPGVAYPTSALPRYPFLRAVSGGNSLLRLRVATALSSFIVTQASFDEYQSYEPWESTLEADCLGNFRQLMDDIVSNARMTEYLNLPGNYVSPDPNVHPNQNFAREFLQLFTVGTTLLYDNGTAKKAANGDVLATYDQNTILDFSRALTGWNYGPVVNQQFVSYGNDYSQPLAPFDQYHDHGAKTLFGTVHLPAGQSITADRKAALDAIFNHPTLPAFITVRLIGQLVKSNPSPAYVQRVVNVFKNNGKGVRGDLTAVVTAILMDSEARAGDKAGVTASDGFLQDPLDFMTFAMNALQQTQWDGQPTYLPQALGQDFWHPNSVFGFYPAYALIPGTTVNSPQFRLFNNLTQFHRSEYLYGMINGTTSGFLSTYQANSWLFTAFTNVPDLIDGLNHQLFHGQMPAATQSEILNYCSGISDRTQAFEAAIFLAMNSD